MEIILYIVGFVLLLVSVFLLVERPYYFGILLLFMMIYRLNIETPLPLDLRGLLTLVMFVRLYIFDKKNFEIVKGFLLRNGIFWLIILFSIIALILPIFNSEKIFSLMKDIILNIIALIIGFIYLSNEQGKKIFFYTIICISIISTLDLMYTYYLGRGLKIVRILDLLGGNSEATINHNFPGMLSSFGIFFLYLLFIRKEKNRLVIILVSLFLLLGVFISTSRSALFALILVIFLITIMEIEFRKSLSKLVSIMTIFLILYFSYLGIYNVFLKSVNKDTFFDKIFYRLYDEPLQIVGLSESNYFDIYSGKNKQGSMRFRSEKWEKDYKKFRQFNYSTQLLGLGQDKYISISDMEYGNRGLIKGALMAHNGYLIILVERGIIGLILYIGIIISTFLISFKYIRIYSINTPLIYLFLFITLYSFAQNSELIAVYTFLFMGGIIGNQYSCEKTEKII